MTMQQVYARKTIGWVGHGDYCVMALGRDGWFVEVCSNKRFAKTVVRMAEAWPTLKSPRHLLTAAANGGVIQLTTGSTLADLAAV